MYRPSTEKRHNQYLNTFIKLFNLTEPQDITAELEPRPYIRDAIIKFKYGVIGFDFEVRDNWPGGRQYHNFPFATLAQLERKFEPEKEIDLTIQTSTDMRWVATAWHRNFGPPKEVERITNHDWLEKGQMRETTKFVIFNITHLDQLKHWIGTTPPPVCDYGTPPVPDWKNCLPCPLYKDGHCLSRGGAIWRVIHGD